MRDRPSLLAPGFPFEPRRFPFFYGWVIVAVASIGMIATIPGQTTGVGAFTESLRAVLGLTHSEIAGAYMIGTGLSGLLLPMAGRFFDRFGVRLTSVGTLVGLSLSLFTLGYLDRIFTSLSNWTGVRSAWLGFSVICVGYFLIRFLGQGVLMMSCRAMLGKWFNVRRGLASSISGMFVSFAFSFSPLALFIMIEHISWQATWMVMAVLLLGLVLPLVWLFFRDNPEECGLEMDGDASLAESRTGRADFIVYKEFRAKEALRTYPFWVFTFALCLLAYVGTVLPYLGESIAGSLGMSASAYFALFGKSAFFHIGFNFFFGWLSGVTRMRYCLLIQACGLLLGAWGLLLLPAASGVWLFAIGNGIAWGGFGTISTVTFPRFFGRKHLGEISGFTMSSLVIASALGPFSFSLLYDLTGTFVWNIYGIGVAAGGLALASLWAENPQGRLKPA